MKSVLISIRPQWCEKIASGKKTIEVRKTAPQEVPFKAYIYETKGQYIKFIHGAHTKYGYGCGKVIGVFVCDEVYEWKYDYCDGVDIDDDTILETSIDREDINIYAKGKTLYGWHISDLKLYDSPKKLSEFYTKKKCNSCKKSGYESTACMYDEDCKVPMSITRAPQSWQYIEDLGEEE